MKILPALALTRAVAKGRGIIETSSGTMALALAMVCASQNRPLTLVTPPLEISLHCHLAALGLTTLITVGADGVPDGGSQGARLRMLKRHLEREPGLVWTRQYENPAVVNAYEPVGQMLLDLGIDCVVASVGSGGSACGIAASLRGARPCATLIGVDAQHSVLFGRPDGPRRFPGMGNSIMPGLLDHSAFDEVHWLADSLIAQCTLEATRQTGMLLGPSGGASLLVARWLAREHPDRRVACVLPEHGTRYLDGLYAANNPGQNVTKVLPPMAPTFVMTPNTYTAEWQAIAWGRRLLTDVLS